MWAAQAERLVSRLEEVGGVLSDLGLALVKVAKSAGDGVKGLEKEDLPQYEPQGVVGGAGGAAGEPAGGGGRRAGRLGPRAHQGGQV